MGMNIIKGETISYLVGDWPVWHRNVGRKWSNYPAAEFRTIIPEAGGAINVMEVTVLELKGWIGGTP